MADWIAALRPHQWAKNFLVFVPLALTPTLAGNDLVDLESDRAHPRKRLRPFARGALTKRQGVALALGLVAGGFLIGTRGPYAFVWMLAVYSVCTIVYTLWLKKRLLLDVVMLAALYTLRVIAGAAAVSVRPTPWLLAFSMFIFVSLAFAKRHSELRETGDSASSVRAYRVEDLGLITVLGASSGYLSVLVLALYISSDEVQVRYETIGMLWALCPLLLYWISRIWFLASRGELPGDPVAFAVRDPASLLTGVLSALVIYAAV
jgi:4-hydroxybenzoate polyprenyltransferase